MRTFCQAIGVLLLLNNPFVGTGAAAQQGAVTGVTVSPPRADAGATVTATVTGNSGVCGAVHINWGDGEAVTYPTSYLPVSKTHVYNAGGTFTVRAQGMGNCAGDTTARVAIRAPAAPVPPPPASPTLGGNITGIDIRPRAARPGESVAITVNGTGTCRVVVDFDDGKDRRVVERLPYRLTYTFAEARDHEIVVWTDEPCTGSGEAIVRVRRQ